MFIRAILVLLVVTLLATTTVVMVVLHPRLDAQQRVDALVVLATVPERYERAEQLMADGMAPTVLYSVAQQSPVTTRAHCRPHMNYRVLCTMPEPNTTQGEAMALAELAQREGWNSIAVLTFDSHVTRARLLVARCYTGDLHMVSMPRQVESHQRLREVAYEVGALARASIVSDCNSTPPVWIQRTIEALKAMLPKRNLAP